MCIYSNESNDIQFYFTVFLRFWILRILKYAFPCYDFVISLHQMTLINRDKLFICKLTKVWQI